MIDMRLFHDLIDLRYGVRSYVGCAILDDMLIKCNITGLDRENLESKIC